MQPPSLQLLYQIQDVASSVYVHSKNFGSILRLKRERSCAMPHFFCTRCNFGARGIAQSHMWQGNVAFQYTKIFKPSSPSRTEDCFHSLSCGHSLRAPHESFHVVAILKQARRQMAADEPGCSGHKDACSMPHARVGSFTEARRLKFSRKTGKSWGVFEPTPGHLSR